MYGTVARMRPMAGRLQDLETFFAAWNAERKPTVPGALASYGLVPDGSTDEVIAVAIFTDEAAYRANAADPEQDGWFRRMRELLIADPEWRDGRIVGG
jgi:hypothetical protein